MTSSSTNSDLNFIPAAQVSQLVLRALENVPALHWVHEFAPAVLISPAGQVSQEVCEFSKVPAAQAVQESCPDVLISPKLLKCNLPVAQVSQEVFAGLAKVPAAHVLQLVAPAALMVPNFDAEKYLIHNSNMRLELHSHEFLLIIVYKSLVQQN